MNVTFVNNNPSSSHVIDAATNQVIFELRSTFLRRSTTMYDASGRVLAEYTRGRLSSSTVRLHGTFMTMKEWLPSRGYLSKRRTLTTSDGRVYEWVLGRELELVDPASGRILATTHKASNGLWSPQQNMGIDVQPELVPVLDDVVFSFALLEAQRRASRMNVATAAGGAAIPC